MKPYDVYFGTTNTEPAWRLPFLWMARFVALLSHEPNYRIYQGSPERPNAPIAAAGMTVQAKTDDQQIDSVTIELPPEEKEYLVLAIQHRLVELGKTYENSYPEDLEIASLRRLAGQCGVWFECDGGNTGFTVKRVG